MGDLLGWTEGLEGVAALLLAIFLVASSRARPAPVLLGLHLVGFVAVLLGLSLPKILGPETLRDDGPTALAVWMGRLLLWVSLIGFAVVYPARRVTLRRAWFLVWAAIPAAAIVVGLAAAPSLFVDAQGTPQPFLRQLITLLRDTGLLISLCLFGRAFLVAPAGARRRQFAYILVPFVLYGLNDGVSEFVQASAMEPALAAMFAGLAVLGIVLVLALAAASAWRLVRSPGERSDDRLFLGWTALSVPAAFVQALSASVHEQTLFLHFLVDGVAVLILFYAVAREQIVDLDVKVRWTIGRGTVAAVFLGVFFVVSQLVQNFFSQGGTNWMVGGVITGLMLFAIHPLQRAAERIAEAAVPRAAPLASMGADDRLGLYRTQVELAWADGVITRREQDLLRTLRDRLGIAPLDAERIESEVGATA